MYVSPPPSTPTLHPQQDHQNAAARREGRLSSKTKQLIADARFPDTFSVFSVEHVGQPVGERQARRTYERAQDTAQCTVNEDGQLQFEGERGFPRGMGGAGWGEDEGWGAMLGCEEGLYGISCVPNALRTHENTPIKHTNI